MSKFQRLAGRVTSSTPTTLTDGDMWVSTSTKKLHRYNGTAIFGVALTTTSTTTSTSTSTSTTTT